MAALYRDYDLAGLDAQYNNRAMVPLHPRHLANWAAASEDARRRLRCRLDLAYGPGSRERLDVFPAAPGAPMHLFIHGGYWRALDKASFSFLAPAFVDAGIAYAALSYPLAPAAGMDEIVAAIGRAIGWVRLHAADWGGDGDRVSLSGHSAGGHLVAMAAAASADGEGGRIVGGVALSGLYDLEPIRLSYLNAELGLDAPCARRNSPIHALHPFMPPLALAVGARESAEYRRQQADFAAALARQGAAPTTLVAAERDHFSILEDLGDARSALFATALALATGR